MSDRSRPVAPPRNEGRRGPLVLARWALVGASLPLAGCMVGPNYKRPPLVPPAAFKSQATSEATPPMAREWWRLYADPNLDRLIETATASNQSLELAVARVDEARALARVAASYLAPTISADPSFSRVRYSGTRASPTTGEPVQGAATVNDWLVPVDLTYEVDVWGRVRRGLESARAQAVASADDEASVRLSVQTDVAQFYYTLRLLDAQVEIVTQTVAAYQEQVRVLSVQVRTGLVGPVALYQAQAQLEATAAQQRDLLRARADQEHALAILCGQPAPSFSVAVNPLRDTSPPEVPAGLPAALLARRPDVASAEQMVVAANAQIGVATANFFPLVALTSSAGFESASVQTPLQLAERHCVDRGRADPADLPAGAAQGQSGRDESATPAGRGRLRQSGPDRVRRRRGCPDRSAGAGRHGRPPARGGRRLGNYLRVAQVQYRNGLVDYLVVIDAERTLLGNQLALAQAENLQLSASIRLIKALGGGWEAGRR